MGYIYELDTKVKNEKKYTICGKDKPENDYNLI